MNPDTKTPVLGFLQFAFLLGITPVTSAFCSLLHLLPVSGCLLVSQACAPVLFCVMYLLALLCCSLSAENGFWTHPMPLAGVQCIEVDVGMTCLRASWGLILCTLPGTLLPGSGGCKVQTCSIWNVNLWAFLMCVLIGWERLTCISSVALS